MFSNKLKFDEGCWNSQMILIHLKEVIILPLEAEMNCKIVSTKLLPLTHCRKGGYFFKNLVNLLGKYPKIRATFTFAQNGCGNIQYLPKIKNVFYPVSNNPT